MRILRLGRRGRGGDPNNKRIALADSSILDELKTSGFTRDSQSHKQLNARAKTTLNYNLARRSGLTPSGSVISFDDQSTQSFLDGGDNEISYEGAVLIEWLEGIWAVDREAIETIEIISSKAINIPALDIILEFAANFSADVGYLLPGRDHDFREESYRWQPFSGRLASSLAIRLILHTQPPGVPTKQELVNGIEFPAVHLEEAIDGMTLPVDVAQHELDRELQEEVGNFSTLILREIESQLPGDNAKNIRYNIEPLAESNTTVLLPVWYFEFRTGAKPKVRTALISRRNPAIGYSEFVASSRRRAFLYIIGGLLVLAWMAYSLMSGL